MSFILDALKKSEADRQQQGGSDFANIPAGSESPGAPRWLWGLGLLLAVVLVAFMTGRIPWPYGILILVLLMIARVSYLKSGKAGRRH